MRSFFCIFKLDNFLQEHVMIIKKTLLFLLVFTAIACSDNDNDNDIEEPIETEPVTYVLLNFTFIQQTNTNEDSISYDIEFFNPNPFEVSGSPKVTLTIGGGGITATGVPNGQCQMISANSSCVLSYSAVDDNPNLFPAAPIEFVSADYIIDNSN
jgi:hypothetical protein